MAVFKCKMCGGALEVTDNQTVCDCEYCGTTQTIPRLTDERKANLYDRANHFRRNNDFDKAMGIYEQILNEDNTDAEAYWSIVLCRYGIEYVEDPATHKRIPTVNRAQYTSIFDDSDYKAAVENADISQKTIYEDEAKAINEIQKGILEISQREEPFDVFICYKESDENGNRTNDSVWAQDIYYQLTEKGFKVFFSRISLESKLGHQYEPYIFAALNSAKVMIVVGSKPEYFNAVWVKNEWSRYIKIAQENRNRLIIPAYKDMDPYDMPDALSYYQALDMGKIGFVQDLIRGIEKVLRGEDNKKTEAVKDMVGENNSNLTALIKRGIMALEDEEWDKAYDFFEQVLNMDAENAEAYYGQVLANYKASDEDMFYERILSDTATVEATEHIAEIDPEFLGSLRDEMNEINLIPTSEFLIDPQFMYWTEKECREAQLENTRAKIENDKLVKRALRFSTEQDAIFKKIETHLYEKMRERIDDAAKKDELVYRDKLQEIDEWKSAMREKANLLIANHLEYKERLYNDCLREYNSGMNYSVKKLQHKFKSLGNYKDALAITKQLEEKYVFLEEKKKSLSNEAMSIMNSFSRANRKKLQELRARYEEIDAELNRIDQQLKW